MSNGRNRLLGISRLNFFFSLMLLAGKQHLRNFTKVNLCFNSEGLEHKWNYIRTLPRSLKGCEFSYYWAIFTFCCNHVPEICPTEKDKI